MLKLWKQIWSQFVEHIWKRDADIHFYSATPAASWWLPATPVHLGWARVVWKIKEGWWWWWVPYQEKKHFHLCLSLSSEESTVFQVVLDDDICDSVKNKLHILGVCGAGEVGVNLLGVLPLVQVLKLTLNVRSCFLVRVGAWKRWGAGSERARKSQHRRRHWMHLVFLIHSKSCGFMQC